MTSNDEQLQVLTNTFSDEGYNIAMLIDSNIDMAGKIDGYQKKRQR